MGKQIKTRQSMKRVTWSYKISSRLYIDGLMQKRSNSIANVFFVLGHWYDKISARINVWCMVLYASDVFLSKIKIDKSNQQWVN